MEEALLQVGLPVKCDWGDCGATGFVKPKCVDPEHGGWYKSKMFRFNRKKRWFCPDHYENGRGFDNKFYDNYRTPEPYTEKVTPSVSEELYKLLD